MHAKRQSLHDLQCLMPLSRFTHALLPDALCVWPIEPEKLLLLRVVCILPMFDHRTFRKRKS